MYNKYHESGLCVLAFPCNQFGGQEPGTPSEIKERIANKFNPPFQVLHPVEVNGSNADPLWVFLKNKLTGFLTNDIKWNFTKFLIDKDGKPIVRTSPQDDPETLIPKIEEILGKNSQ